MSGWIWVVVGVWAVAVVFAVGLGRAAGHRMPTPPPVDAPWQPDPGSFARCPGCGTLRPVAGGVIAAHERPEPWVPFDQASARCTGTGRLPDTGGAGYPDPRAGIPAPPGKDSETVRRGNAAVEETGHLPPSMFARCGNHAERAKPPGKWLAADDFQDPVVPVDAGRDGCRTSEANHPPVGGAAGPGPVARPTLPKGMAPTGRDT
jgi:hypothetical protein